MKPKPTARAIALELYWSQWDQVEKEVLKFAKGGYPDEAIHSDMALPLIWAIALYAERRMQLRVIDGTVEDKQANASVEGIATKYEVNAPNAYLGQG